MLDTKKNYIDGQKLHQKSEDGKKNKGKVHENFQTKIFGRIAIF